jgi:hypothetical protein
LLRLGTVKPQEPNVLDETITFWSQRTGQALSREDARQIVVNVSGLFQVLEEWARKDASRDGPNDPLHTGGREGI